MRFTFIHAADLHVDSPLAALGAKDAAVAARFARAGRKAVSGLVDEAIASKAAFLIIAGDVFDGEWRDAATGQFMVRELARVVRAQIQVFVIKGNHDAESKIARDLSYPDGVTIFGSRKADTKFLSTFNIALHGRSYPDREPPADFAASYPPAKPGYLNIGILHTALDRTDSGHAAYAPCTPAQLAAFGYDYWALGHIHQPEIVARDPWIVYPGNIQGRNVRETGPRGAMRVTVEDGRITHVEPIVLDAARFAHETIDVSGATKLHDVHDLIGALLARVHGTAQDRPLALRLTLRGTTHLHLRMMAQQMDWQDDIRAQASHLAEDFWLERLVVDTRPPAASALPSGEADTLDLAGLLAAAASETTLHTDVRADMRLLANKMPGDLRADFEHENADNLARILAQARDLLLGRLEPDGAAGL